MESEKILNKFGTGFEGNSGAEHLSKRQREGYYTELTVAQYEKIALTLLHQDIGENVDGFETEQGKIVRWDKTTVMKRAYACPCCREYTLKELGGYEICPICDWEDDPGQSKYPDDELGANTKSLNAYRKAWQQHNDSVRKTNVAV